MTSLPVGFGIELDPAAREVAPGVWLGGQPARTMRLTDAGTTAWAELRRGPVRTSPAGLLARRLIDAGLAHPVPPASHARPDLTVVVPVHDRAVELDRCLASLGRSQPVLVVDDASADELAVRAVATRHGATVVRLDVNAGPAAARNAGLCRVTTEFVAFVDSDTLPGARCIAELAAHLADPLVAAVAPRIVGLGGDDGWAGRYARARSNLDLGPDRANVRPYTRVSYVPTAALVARRQALLDVAVGADVFDPSLRVGEDVDLVWRLLDDGWRVRYEPDTHVAHEEPSTIRALLRRRARYGTSAAPLARKHPQLLAPLIVHPWTSAAVFAVVCRRPLIGATVAAIGALRTGRALKRASVPARHAPRLTGHALCQTALGISRYVTQFGAPALVVAAFRGGPRLRGAAATLLLGPPLAGWLQRRPPLDPVRYAAACIAEDAAYGAGVVRGCLAHRTTVPLRPVRSTHPAVRRR